MQRQNLYYDNTLIISLGVFAKYNMATKYATGPPSPTNGKQSQSWKKQLLISPQNNRSISQKYVLCQNMWPVVRSKTKKTQPESAPKYTRKENRKNQNNLSWYNHKDNKYTGWAEKETFVLKKYLFAIMGFIICVILFSFKIAFFEVILGKNDQ